MKCAKCGADIPDGDNFCPSCGSGVQNNVNIENNKPPKKSGAVKIIAIILAFLLGVGGTVGILAATGVLDFSGTSESSEEDKDDNEKDKDKNTDKNGDEDDVTSTVKDDGDEKEEVTTGSSVSAPTGYTSYNTEFIIGASGPLTGPNASYGVSVMQGAKLAVNEINATGGLNGIKYKLDMKDDRCTASDAQTAYEALYENGMQVSLGSVTSGSAEAFVECAKEDGVFTLTPSASHDDVINASEYSFRVCFGDPDSGIYMAQILAKDYDNIGVIYETTDSYSSGIYEAFAEEMKNLGESFIEQTFDYDNNKDFLTQVEALKDCDVIFLPVYYMEAWLIANACATMGCDAALFGCDGLQGVENLINSSVTNEICYMTPFDVNSTDTKTAAFVKNYEKAYGSLPDQFAADGYDAVYAIYEAMKLLGISDVTVSPDVLGEQLVEIFTSSDFNVDGVTGNNMRWYKNGECTKQPIIVKAN